MLSAAWTSNGMISAGHGSTGMAYRFIPSHFEHWIHHYFVIISNQQFEDKWICCRTVKTVDCDINWPNGSRFKCCDIIPNFRG